MRVPPSLVSMRVCFGHFLKHASLETRTPHRSWSLQFPTQVRSTSGKQKNKRKYYFFLCVTSSSNFQTFCVLLRESFLLPFFLAMCGANTASTCLHTCKHCTRGLKVRNPTLKLCCYVYLRPVGPWRRHVTVTIFFWMEGE
jgi:hypothetical protein